MLTRLVILNSNTFGKAIVRLDDCDSIQFAGPNNVGKSTLVYSLNFLFIIDGKKMTLVVTLADSKEEVGKFELEHGRSGRVFKCK